MNTAQATRVEKTWGEIAKESISVREIGGEIYAFGSELAMLRLGNKMPGRVEYSENLESWFFVPEKLAA